MPEVEISVNHSYENPEEGIPRGIRPLLAEFKLQHSGANVSLLIYNWGRTWAEFMKISLYRHGPVVSQTGNSWMGSLIAQNTLRVITDGEMTALGGHQNFLSESWHSCLDFDNKSVVAIPWIVDTYLVYYRRDLLTKAGLDEAVAFSTPENFYATLQALQENGVDYPYAVPTYSGLANMHLAASWVWDQGGDFIDAEGTRVLLSKPETRRGMKMYFDLYRFITPRGKHLSDQECWQLFLDGEIAVTMRNPEFLFQLTQGKVDAQFADKIGTAVMPGVPLLGGSHLVMWKHIRYEQEQHALALIKFLTTPEAELAIFEKSGLIPANLQALERIGPVSIYDPVIQSVKTGRAFPRIRMWGLIEDKMIQPMSHIWSHLLDTPDPNVEQVIAEHLDPVEKKLNLALSQ